MLRLQYTKFILLLLLPSLVFSQALRSDSINPIPSVPWATTAPALVHTWQSYESAGERAEAATPFIYSGGLHTTTSGTLTTNSFSTTAYVPERVKQSSAAITYSASASDTCWTIISSDTDGIAGWTRVGVTAYYYKCGTGTEPSLPSNSAWLLKATIVTSQIQAVEDKRSRVGELPVYSYANLPSPGRKGARAIVSDGVRGEWVDNGVSWVREDSVIDLRRDFGMLCNDSTDEASVIQAAINAVTSTYSVIRAPIGNCIIGTKVNGVSNMTLIGQGTGRTIFKQKPATQINDTMVEFNTKSNVTVSGITFDGNKANQGTLVRRIVLLGFSTGTESRVIDNEFKNGYGKTGSGIGVGLGFGGLSNRNWVMRNYFHDMGDSLGVNTSDCLYYSGWTLHATDNHIENCTDTGIAFESKSSDPDNPADNTVIANNTFSGNIQSIGISAAGGNFYTGGVTVTGNFIEGHQGSATGAIYLLLGGLGLNPIKRVVIANNVIVKTTVGYGIYVEKADGVVISGNFVSRAGTIASPAQSWSGIYVRESTHIQVVGNTSAENGNTGINFQGVTDSVILQNSVWNNCGVGNVGGIAIGEYSVTSTQSVNISVMGNVVRSPFCSYGVNIANSSNNITVRDNDLSGNGNINPVAISGSATNTRLFNNIQTISGTFMEQAMPQTIPTRTPIVTFANLVAGTTGTGPFICTDCRSGGAIGSYAGPCAYQASGASAMVFRISGTWMCLGTPAP